MAGGTPGPRRSERAHTAILTAAVDELTLNGHDRFSLDRVAKSAGRWYPSKSALLAECVLLGYISTPNLLTANTGDVWKDVLAWIHAFARYSSEPVLGAQLPATTAAAAESPAIAAQCESHVVASTQEALAERLRQAISDGQLLPGTPVQTLAQTLVGSLLFRVLIRQPLDEAFLEELMTILFTTRNTDGPGLPGGGAGNPPSTATG